MLHPDDLSRLGLEIDQRVTVRSATGALDVVVGTIDIHPGNAVMYYPEANVLIPRRADPRSGTPSFKHTKVVIEKKR